MSTTVTVPVDLDAPEERITSQLSVRALMAAAAALGIGLITFRALGEWAAPLRALAAGLAAAASWALPTARVEGATTLEWTVRAVRFAAGPRRLIPGAGRAVEVER